MATRKSTARKRSASTQAPAATRPVSLDTIELLAATFSKVRGIIHACQQTDAVQDGPIENALWAAMDLLDDADKALQAGGEQ
jgi:hypothetical protein